MAANDAFTAGVRPGGLTSSTEIRLLTADDYGRLTGHTVDLEPEEVLVQAENLDLPDTFYIEDLPFHIAGTIMDFPRYNSSILISGQTAQLFLGLLKNLQKNL